MIVYRVKRSANRLPPSITITLVVYVSFLDIAARGRFARRTRAATMPEPAEFQRPRVSQRAPAAAFGRRLFRDANPGHTAVGSPGLRARQGERGPRPVRGREDR